MPPSCHSRRDVLVPSWSANELASAVIVLERADRIRVASCRPEELRPFDLLHRPPLRSCGIGLAGRYSDLRADSKPWRIGQHLPVSRRSVSLSSDSRRRCRRRAFRPVEFFSFADVIVLQSRDATRREKRASAMLCHHRHEY